MKPTVGSLFSGIGGLELGLERAGFETRFQCEVNPCCSRVLKKNWPNVPNLGDVTKIDWSTVERVDVICGGYPCQPFSLAGARRGEQDDRHLWPHMRDAIRVLRPRLALLENVPGHLSLGFGTVLGDLADIGYDAEWDCIPAAAVGAPHLRYRVFIVAHARSDQHESGRTQNKRTPTALFPVAYAGGERRQQERGGAPRDEAADAGRPAQPDHVAERDGESSRAGHVADSDGGRLEERGERDSRTLRPEQRTSRRNDTDRRGANVADADRAFGSAGETIFGPETVERLRRRGSSLGDDWATQPRLGRGIDGFSAWLDGSWEDGIARVATGVPNRVDRLRALGNAVVPQVAQFIGEQLIQYLEVA